MLALLLWSMAAYGMIIAIIQIAHRVRGNRTSQHALLVLLVVHNGEDYVEGLLRTLLYRLKFSKRDLRIVVIDQNSNDRTSDIVQIIAERDNRVELQTWSAQVDVQKEIEQIWKENTERSICICDVRNHSNPGDIIPLLIGIVGK